MWDKKFVIPHGATIFRELETPDDGRVRPKHVVRRRRGSNKLHCRRKYIKYNIIRSRMLATCFLLVYCLVYSSTLNMQATYSFEISVHFQWKSRHYIPQDRTLHNHRCENLHSYIIYADYIQYIQSLMQPYNYEFFLYCFTICFGHIGAIIMCPAAKTVPL
jgi:hypothetical protein